jgi:NDP-sugar pyrophosphorylase family protein
MALPCVILAGGLATRMRPMTERVPKTLLPVRGTPFADLQLTWLRAQGIEHVVYSLGHQASAIREHVGDGTRYGLHVVYVDEGAELRGTGGALRLAVETGAVRDAFFALNGDSYLTVDLSVVERAFESSDLPALMTVLRNDDRWDASNAIVEDGRVVLYDKRRPADRRAAMRWIDYGISILRAGVVAERIPSRAKADMADLMRDLSIAGRLAAFEVSERFYEIGSPRGLRDLEAHLARAQARDVRAGARPRRG